MTAVTDAEPSRTADPGSTPSDADAGRESTERDARGQPPAASTGGEFDRSPAIGSVVIAIAFALLGALTMPTSALVGVGILGTALVGVGAIRGSRRLVGYGALVLLAGVLIGGFQGAPPEPLVLSTLFAVLAWDVGRYGITIGEQLGRGAETFQLELTHAALSTLVGTAGAGLGYATYRVTTGGQPVAALFLLVVGAVVLVVTLR